MRKIVSLSTVLLLVLFFTCSSSVAQTSGEKSYTPSSQCQKCHEREYLSWNKYMHAKSVSTKNILFTKIYDMTLEETKGAAKEKCLPCHAPIAVALGDLNLRKNISREGVNCDYCHTLKAEKKEDGTVTLISSPGETKYGPYSDSVTEAHKIEFSEIHTKAEFCFTCHYSVKNPAGIEICTTEAEWRDSIYAKKNIECQVCHMPVIPGKAALNGPERDKIHMHNFSGGHDSEHLDQAAVVQLKTEEADTRKTLIVSVFNLNGGHYLPTSSPLRMMILRLYAYDSDGKEIWTNWKNDPIKEDSQAVFAKFLTDDNGNPAFPWKATKIAFDTRLKIRETRTLTYPLPQDLSIARITADLQYKLSPDVLLAKLQIDESELKNLYTIARAELSLQNVEDAGAAAATAKPAQRAMVRTIKLYAESWKFTPAEIRIKQGERVKLIISTLDDTHGFRVKDMGINVKVFTGKPVEVEIEGKEKGEYKFDCPVPCGDRCFKMKGVIIVE